MATIVITLKDVTEEDGSPSVDVSFIGNERFGNKEVTSADKLTSAELLFFALFGLIEYSSYSGIDEAVLAVEEILMYEEDDLDDTLEDLKNYLDHDEFLGVIGNVLGDDNEDKPRIRLVVNNDKDKEE